ncbi:MAG: HU family DNA-binding protein [Anaerolinea sp.]|nr:HU family DNA-binding protein [Anaerolinea sp.]
MVRPVAMQSMNAAERRVQCGLVSRCGVGSFGRGGGAYAAGRPQVGRAPDAPPSESQLNRWLLKRRRASVQRLAAAAPVRRCYAPAERVDGIRPCPHAAPRADFAGEHEPVRKRTRKVVPMNHRQLVSAAARRFPDLTQRQVEDVLEVLVEVWSTALAHSDEVMIRNLGTLRIEVQQMRNSGVIQAQMGSSSPEHLMRLYFRFRPTAQLKAAVERQLKEHP